MKNRLTYWRSTLPGLGVLAFLAIAAWLRPELLDNTETLIALGLGLAAIFHRKKAQ